MKRGTKDLSMKKLVESLETEKKDCTTCGTNAISVNNYTDIIPCTTCNFNYINWKPREEDKENMVFATFDKRTHVVVKREEKLQ